MAGLSVLLETHESNSINPQIISKATLQSPKISSSSLLSPAAAMTAASTSSFLQRCLLCRKELGEDNDIYMYRGDRAFCSVECRCRQIFMDEDACNSYCAKGAAAARSSRRATTGTAAAGGGGGGGGGVSFAY